MDELKKLKGHQQRLFFLLNKLLNNNPVIKIPIPFEIDERKYIPEIDPEKILIKKEFSRI